MLPNCIQAIYSRRKVVVAALALTLLVAPAFAVAAFGVNFNTVLSGSMRPTIVPGDLVISGVTTVENLQVGDVVILMNETTMQTQSHRITQIETSVGSLFSFVAKGDANTASEFVQNVDGRMPVRKVTVVVPKIGLFTDFFESHRSKFVVLLLTIPVFVFFSKRIRTTQLLNHNKNRTETRNAN